MMALSRSEIEGLLALIGLTSDTEIDCDRCLLVVAEFAEHELTGKSVPEGLEVVQQHLSVCAECREEYEALKRAMEELDA